MHHDAPAVRSLSERGAVRPPEQDRKLLAAFAFRANRECRPAQWRRIAVELGFRQDRVDPGKVAILSNRPARRVMGGRIVSID